MKFTCTRIRRVQYKQNFMGEDKTVEQDSCLSMVTCCCQQVQHCFGKWNFNFEGHFLSILKIGVIIMGYNPLPQVRWDPVCLMQHK